jgi:diphthine-ammonia ligase
MKLGVLFSGGKDSCYSAYLEKKKGNKLTCLISIFSENEESYMFHTPNIKLVEKQAKVMNIPIIIQKTKGKKEEELIDLEKAIKKAKDKYKIQGIITGALHSVYQASRIQKICDNLHLKCINPLWHINTEIYWKKLLKDKFEVMITGVASDGLYKEWLGVTIDKESFEKLRQLKEKFKFHLAFEGGEAETFITDCPLFKKKIKVIKGKMIWQGNSGRYDIKRTELIDK